MEIDPVFLIVPALSLGLLLLGFWIWMLVDCMKNEPSEGYNKLAWVLVIIFTKAIGAAIYYFVRRPERLRMESAES